MTRQNRVRIVVIIGAIQLAVCLGWLGDSWAGEPVETIVSERIETVNISNPDGIWTHCTNGHMLKYGDYCWIEKGTKIRIIKPGAKRHLVQAQDSGNLGCPCPSRTLFYLSTAKFDEFRATENRKKAVAERLEKEREDVVRAIKDNEFYTPPYSPKEEGK